MTAGGPTLPARYFDALYAESGDPWSFTSRWYEERKRALTLALLPASSYPSAVELGCSIGVLTSQLASRCGRLLATDVSPAAVAATRERCARQPQVRVVLDGGWPGGTFDLAVVSEVLYYFSRVEAEAMASDIARCDTVLGIHWRHEVADYPLSGDEAQAVLDRACAAAGRTVVARYTDADVLATVWSLDPRSVATHEGLT